MSVWACEFPQISFGAAYGCLPQCDRVLKKLRNLVSPCVIYVVYSVEFQIRPDEVEDDGEVMLIWNFNVDKIISVTASQCSVKARNPSSVTTIDCMPHLDVNRVNCNCSNPLKQGNILLTSCAATSFPIATTVSAPEIISLCGVTETLFTESFALKGNSYQEHFQKTLKKL